MNREILFRGKRIDNGEWVFGDLQQDRDLDQVWIGGWDYYCDGDGLQREPFMYEVKPATVGQFTGLIDKRGAKIFEGDFVRRRWNEGVMKYKVAFDNCLSAFIGNRIGSVMFTSFDGDGDLFEVIGNIYDDPELEEVAQ